MIFLEHPYYPTIWDGHLTTGSGGGQGNADVWGPDPVTVNGYFVYTKTSHFSQLGGTYYSIYALDETTGGSGQDNFTTASGSRSNIDLYFNTDSEYGDFNGSVAQSLFCYQSQANNVGNSPAQSSGATNTGTGSVQQFTYISNDIIAGTALVSIENIYEAAGGGTSTYSNTQDTTSFSTYEYYQTCYTVTFGSFTGWGDVYVVPTFGTDYAHQLIGDYSTRTNTTVAVITGTHTYDTRRSNNVPTTTTTALNTTVTTYSSTFATYTFLTISTFANYINAVPYFYTEIVPEVNARSNEWVWVAQAPGPGNNVINPRDPYKHFTEAFSSRNAPMFFSRIQNKSVVVTPKGGGHVNVHGFPDVHFGSFPVQGLSIPSTTYSTIGYDPNSPNLPLSGFVDTYNCGSPQNIVSNLQYLIDDPGSTMDVDFAIPTTVPTILRDPPFIRTDTAQYIDTNGLTRTYEVYSVNYLTHTGSTDGYIDALRFPANGVSDTGGQYFQGHTETNTDGGETITHIYDYGLDVSFFDASYINQYSNVNVGPQHRVTTTGTSTSSNGSTYIPSTIAGIRFQIPPFIDATDNIYAGLHVFSSFENPDSFSSTNYFTWITNEPLTFWKSACAGRDVYVFMSLDDTYFNTAGNSRYVTNTYGTSNTIYSLNLHDTLVIPYNADESFTVNYKVTSSSIDDNNHTFSYVATSSSFQNEFRGLVNLNDRICVSIDQLYYTPTFGGLPQRSQDPVTIAALGVYSTYGENSQSGLTTIGDMVSSIPFTWINVSSNLFYARAPKMVKTAAVEQYWPYINVFYVSTFDQHVDGYN